MAMETLKRTATAFRFVLFSGLSLAHAWAGPGVVVDRIESIIGKDIILRSDIDRLKTEAPLKSKIDFLFASHPLSKNPSPTRQELRTYLEGERLALQKFPVSDSDVTAEIESIKNQLKIDTPTLKAALGREGVSFEQYTELMRASLAKRQLLDREIRNKVNFSDQDLYSEYLKSKKPGERSKGDIHLQIVKFDKADYKTPALAKQQLQEALKRDTPFNELVKDQGTDLGFLSVADLNPAYVKASEGLKKDQISGINEDATAFFVVKLVDQKSGQDSAFEKEKDRIRAKLAEVEYQRQITFWIERQMARTTISRPAP